MEILKVLALWRDKMDRVMSKALIQVLFWAVSVISWLKFVFLMYLFHRLILPFWNFFPVLLKKKL